MATVYASGKEATTMENSVYKDITNTCDNALISVAKSKWTKAALLAGAAAFFHSMHQAGLDIGGQAGVPFAGMGLLGMSGTGVVALTYIKNSKMAKAFGNALKYTAGKTYRPVKRFQNARRALSTPEFTVNVGKETVHHEAAKKPSLMQTFKAMRARNH